MTITAYNSAYPDNFYYDICLDVLARKTNMSARVTKHFTSKYANTSPRKDNKLYSADTAVQLAIEDSSAYHLE